MGLIIINWFLGLSFLLVNVDKIDYEGYGYSILVFVCVVISFLYVYMLYYCILFNILFHIVFNILKYTIMAIKPIFYI
jgi:hypothetical protein